MITFKKLSQREKYFTRLTGLKVVDFLKLIDLIQDDWKKLEQAKIKQGRVPKLKTLHDKTLCLLIYYRTYANMLFIGMLFDLDDSNVARLFQKLEKIIAPHMAFKKLINKELSQEETLNLLIDASEVQIERPSKKSLKNKHYSGKKKKHTAKFEIIRSKKTGKILGISKIYYSKMHDFKLRKSENKRGNRLPDDYNIRICADSGYQGMQKMFEKSEISLPKKRRKNVELTEEEKQKNRENASERVPIEHAIGKMKKFKILDGKYRNHLKKLHLRVINIAGLINLAMGFTNC